MLLVKNDSGSDNNELIEHFQTNLKEMKWSKGEKLFNAFLNSL